jgi:hypothetical protein
VEILSSEPLKNHLLAALPHAESQRWLPLLEPVDFSLGEVLYESGITGGRDPPSVSEGPVRVCV